MPKFEMIPKDEAVKKTALSGRRREIAELYMFFIDQLQEGRAGKLKPSDGETVQAIRRRLGAAAKLANKSIVIKRVGDEVYFWLGTEEKPKSRKKKKTNSQQNIRRDST